MVPPRERRRLVSGTTRMMPFVVLPREDRLDALHRITDRAVADGQLDMWADLKARNGWSSEAIVAGSILSNAPAITDEANR